MSCQVSRFDSTIREAITQIFGIAFLDVGNFPEIRLNGTVADQFDIVEPHYLRAVVIDRAVARRRIDDRIADRFPDRATPAGVKRFASPCPAGFVGGPDASQKDWEIPMPQNFIAGPSHASPRKKPLKPQMDTDKHR